MARIDKVRESYENITERLFSDKDAFAEYLKFAGKFFKLPSAQSMLLYGENPNATMVADYDTWTKFDRHVKRGTSSIAVLDNGGLKHYFDISQTNGSKTPYQWTLDKNTAGALIDEVYEQSGMRFKSFSGCVNYLGAEQARETAENVMKTLNVSEENRAAFEKSYASMTQYLIAARCEMGATRTLQSSRPERGTDAAQISVSKGNFKYNGKLDLSALDMLHSKAEKERLCEFVQLAGKSVLMSLEKSINNIVMQERTVDYGRNKTDMVRPERLVRGGQDVLPRNQGGERQDVQTRPDNVRVSGTNGVGTDGGRTGTDERADRAVGREMAQGDGGNAPRTDTVASRSAAMGTDTPTDRPRSVGAAAEPQAAVREEISSTVGREFQRGDGLGEHVRSDSGRGNISNSGAGSYRVSEDSKKHGTTGGRGAFAQSAARMPRKQSERSATYSTENKQTAEENSSAFSVDEISIISDRHTSEAFESAEQLLSAINSASLSEDKPIEIPADIDKFYVNRDTESVTQVYYNPDSDAGGQLVYNHFTFDDIFEAIIKDDPLDYLAQKSRQELVDVGSSDFPANAREFLADNEDFNSKDEHFSNKLSTLVEPTYSIFQIKEGGDLRDYRFADISELRERGLNVDSENYREVYRGRLKDGETLDDLFTKFNVNRPEDFRGHSLSVSDIICIHQNGKTAAHYIDSVGFEKIPDFFLSREERKARRTLTDNLTLIADNQLASDDMDTLGDKLFDYDNTPKYSGSSSSWLLGGMTADEFESITTRYHNGEDIRAELAKKMYSKLNNIEFFDFPSSDGIYDVEISAAKDESGITFRTKGGFEIAHSWETLGDALITAARKEFDRHLALDKAYSEDAERNGSLYLALLEKRTIHLDKINADGKFSDYRLEFVEGKGNVIAATDENNNRIEIRSFSMNGRGFVIQPTLEEYTVKNIEREPVFKVEANTQDGLEGEAFLQAYEKTENDTLIPGEILYVGSFDECNRFAGYLRRGENTRETIKNWYEKVSEQREISAAKAAVEAFKEKTAANFSPVNGFNAADIEKMVRDYAQNVLEDSGIDAKIVDLAVAGSRSRALESDNSDLDVVIEFTSDLKEDALFNILHEKPFEIGGVTVDINPIRKEETGTLGTYLENAEKTIFENHERKAAENSREQSVTAYRVGDFYEFFDKDAQTTSDLLNLTLVKRQDVPMTGVPFHTFENYKAKLAAQGYNVKIGDNRELEKILNLKREERADPRSESIFLDEAKERINEYTQREFGENADYTDLSHIPLAYTTHEETDVEISVYANLTEKSIVTMYGGEIADKELFDSNEEMLGALGNLDFDELVAVDEDVVERLTNAKEKENGILQAEKITENKQTTEEKSPAFSLSKIADGILALDVAVRDSGSNMFVEDYFEEQTTDKRVHIMNMLTSGNYKPLRDYLGAVYAEAYENREMLAEGTRAQNILARIDALDKTEDRETPERSAEKRAKSAESAIHFGLLGNGITAYDTSKTDKETNDYPTVAHISDEGNIKYYTDDLSEEDKRRIEGQAARQKRDFTESWNKLPIENRFERLSEAAAESEHYAGFSRMSGMLTMEETVKKFEHSLVFKDEPFPAAEREPRTPEEIYKGMSDVDRTFFDANAYADILHLEKLVQSAAGPATKTVQEHQLDDREKMYAERFGTTTDEFRALIRYHEAELKKQTVTVSPDDLRVGDYVRGDGAIWRITGIDGDFSIAFENTDKSDIRSVQSIIGHWKDHFVKDGFEYVAPDEIRQTVDTPAEPVAADDKDEEFEEIPDEPINDYTYGEQISLFGEPAHEVENPPKTIIDGVDIEEALKRELISGTGFVDGKFRVEQFYREHKGDTKGFARFLSDAYGVGGHSGEGRIWLINYDSKGLSLNIRLNGGESTAVSWSWSKVANRIATLIDNHEYITERDIDERIKRAKRDMAHNAEDSKEYRAAAEILDNYGLLPEKEDVQRIEPSEIKAGDSFMYRGSLVTVTDDKGIYPDDIVITRKEKTGGLSLDVTENVNAAQFAREARRITPETEKQTVQQERTETTAATEQAEEPTVEIKNLAQLKRTLTVGAEFDITSYIRDDVFNQRRRVNYADTVSIYSIRPDAPDDKKTTLANGGRGSCLYWEKASDWEFTNGVCTAYRKGMKHTEENRLYSIKVIQPVLKRETENRQTAEISNPLVKELAKTFDKDIAEKLYNAFEGAKMDDWKGNQAKINRVKRALYDILGNEEQTESAFDVLAAGEAPKLKDIVIDLSPNTARYEREEKPVENVEKCDFTITDEHLGEGGAKEKFAANIAAIETLKRIESRNLNLAADMFKASSATPEEQKILAGYVGWGGLSQAFDPNNKAWEKEYRQLKELLTDEEYATAKGSTLNAHYTTPTVIGAIYKGLQNLGFEGGNVLEPAMGVGNFFGCMPEEIRQNSHLSGVELDSITGRIAQQLYQNADIQVKGFEKTDFSDNYFDAAVGNVPFGSYPVSDKRYNRENFFIHDYFLAKTLDKLAPGGIAALITTKGTLDKENPKVREYLARRADLIGAIRLPNNAFKANAGTEVTTDILFLQKREKMAVELPDWCYIGKNNEGVPVNNYFLDHPEMILGTMKQGLEFSLYGNASETACVPVEGADLKQQLDKAVANLKTNNAIRKHAEQRKAEAGVIAATADVRNFTFAEVDGKMYFRENNIMTEAADKKGNALAGKALERIRALCELRQTFRTILTAQENDCSDAQLQAYQKILNAQYDAFVKKYGYINDSANYQVFGKDDDYNSLCALELVNEETHEVTKSAFFSKRTVKHITEVTRVDTPQEALFVSVDTLGKLDIPYMAKLCEKSPDEVIDALKADNLIYLNPKKANPEKPYEGWEEASEYLSGNVRIKLRTAERAAEDNPSLRRNVDALTAVIPKRIEAGDITARIGVHWVDVEDYQKFLQEYAKARFALGEPLRRAHNGEYKIPYKGRDYSKAATEIYGTKRMNALEIFENLLNNRDVVVKDKKIDPDGKEHYEINKKETELAQDKASKMKEAFKRWLWEDPERREKYVTRYNELFNCIVGRKYDGSHQTFPGMSPSISLKPHQLDAVARAKFGGNTLLAHCVGAGKSFEMVAATMEKKRLGLINKACVVVPKALVGQMASEWLRLYPQAKILTATEKDFDKDHRQKFIGRCCTGDYDAVIMSYEQFEKIPMSFEYRRDFIQREIDTLTTGIDDLKFNGGRNENSGSIKDMERTKKRLEARLQKLIEDNGKTKDTSLNFEQLGFDSLVVDEAHNYKNGLVVTKMQRVAGVQTTPAQKSEDILMKTRYLNENYGERNLLFATGTPVSNSMSELYIMQRYLRPSLLDQAGLQTFDDWASTFGEVVSKAEMKPAGNGYRTKKRFAKFNNLPELMAMYKEFADIRTADMLDLPVPKIKGANRRFAQLPQKGGTDAAQRRATGGKPETIVAEPNAFQKEYMKVLAQRSEQVHSGAVDATKDNMLKITGEARLLGLDVRSLNPEAPNYPDSKVNLLINKIMEIYTQTTPQKGVQAVFCDIAVNGDNEAEELSEGGEQKAKKAKSEKSEEGKFSVYNYIKAELIRRGVPADEICFAGDADTVKKQNEMKAQLRSGTKRIVLSSTSKLGTGANIQNKLVALHNLDIPWKPSDLEQRLGRIVRQGNENDEVGIYNYVTKDTFDAYMMNIIVTKQKFISQLNTTTSRSCEDVDDLVLNYSEIQAMAVGDERIKEKIELDMDVSRLKMLESEHYNEQYRLDDTIADAQKLMKNLTHNITAAKDDLAFAQENRYASEDFKVEIGANTMFAPFAQSADTMSAQQRQTGGKVYTERKEAGTALREAAVEFMANDNGGVRQPVGTFCGFELSVGKFHNGFGDITAEIVIRHGISYSTDMDLFGDIGNTTRLENLFGGGIEKKIKGLEEKAERTNADLQAALANKGKPFEHAEELSTKSARLEQLNLELEVGKADEVIIADDESDREKDAHDIDRDKPAPPKHKRR